MWKDTKNSTNTVENSEMNITKVIETKELTSKITFWVEQSIRLWEYESLKPSMYVAKEYFTSDLSDEVLNTQRNQAVTMFSSYKIELIDTEIQRVKASKDKQKKIEEEEAKMLLEDTIASLESYIEQKQSMQFLTKVFQRLVHEYENFVWMNHKEALEYNSAIKQIKEKIALLGKEERESKKTDVVSNVVDKKESEKLSIPTIKEENKAGTEKIQETTKVESIQVPEVKESVVPTGKVEEIKNETVMEVTEVTETLDTPTTPEVVPEIPKMKSKKEVPTLLENGARWEWLWMKIITSVNDLPKEILEKAKQNTVEENFWLWVVTTTEEVWLAFSESFLSEILWEWEESNDNPLEGKIFQNLSTEVTEKNVTSNENQSVKVEEVKVEEVANTFTKVDDDNLPY